MNPSIADFLPDERIIVVCGRPDDAQAWRGLLGSRGLAIPLDDAPPGIRPPALSGASAQLAWQHHAIAGLDGSGWLAGPADAFDPNHTARLALPDPLDPPSAGTRRRIGQRHPTWRLFEDKTIVDALWVGIGLPRARSIVADGVAEAAALGALVDRGSGVVCSCQPAGSGPTAGGDGIWWWQHGSPPTAIQAAEHCGSRVRLMPLLEGLPVRLHGFTLARTVTVFPPMELVTLPRIADGTFVCAGAVQTLRHVAELGALTEHIGVGLRDRLGYRGGFSVDGIVTADGFLPTDFNARLTSAMEAAPPEWRVQLHLANLLCRDGIEPAVEVVEALAANVFDAKANHTLYGAARRVNDDAPREVAIQWDGPRLVLADPGAADGHLTVQPSPRGWLLTATLDADRIHSGGGIGPFAPEVFRLSDGVFGTDFGDLAPPVGAPNPDGSPLSYVAQR